MNSGSKRMLHYSYFRPFRLLEVLFSTSFCQYFEMLKVFPTSFTNGNKVFLP